MTSEVVLRVTGVRKSYGSRAVLRGVDLQVHQGELVGIVGENGAGKTTLLRVLCGELRADHGEIAIDGTLGYCPQRTVLDDELTVAQHLRLFQTAYRIASLQHTEDLLAVLGLAQHRDTPAKALSGGTRQKLNLVLALMHDPEVVLLDEPYQGFDWETYLAFWKLAATLRDNGCAVVVISHFAHDTERLDAVRRLRGGVLEPAMAGGRV
ncbi:ABC transporter ATP-binding protein [Solihabitans fulvus]|uniref:ABC transporter ATP-binding protein n=1 Tax=Solihabitans fulvus TaxID=1892852 RepID=A0A5B2X2S0_9PSEU|nr:ABC transporter ATP-binding protein [Solihabitans fulvus]KAA2257518.1 ABC transporter ATP-binding protein [Solihabitans fulvus]